MDINVKNAILHIDVNCYKCKKLIALSNSIEVDGRSYCQRCAKPILIVKLRRLGMEIED